jgi:hypothetical protein
MLLLINQFVDVIVFMFYESIDKECPDILWMRKDPCCRDCILIVKSHNQYFGFWLLYQKLNLISYGPLDNTVILRPKLFGY